MSATDGARLRQILGHLPTCVVLVTATDEQGPVGLAVGSFVSVSLAPPLVGFFVGRDSTTWPRLAPLGVFAVNVLREDHGELARHFSRSGVDRFAAGEWIEGRLGVPLLTDAVAQIECDADRVVAFGDHWLVTGLVRDARVIGDGQPPLVFHRGGFAGVGVS